MYRTIGQRRRRRWIESEGVQLRSEIENGHCTEIELGRRDVAVYSCGIEGRRDEETGKFMVGRWVVSVDECMDGCMYNQSNSQ